MKAKTTETVKPKKKLIRDYAREAKLANPKAIKFTCPIECRTCQTKVRYIEHRTCVNCNTQSEKIKNREAELFSKISNIMFVGASND